MPTVTMDQFTGFLDDISVAFIERNYELWRGSMLLPFSMVTKDGPVVLRNEAEVRDNYNHYLLAADAMRLDRVYRTPISLEDCEDGTWLGTYKTHLLSKNQHATAPYVSSALLKATSDGPKMLSILNARGHHEWVGEHPTIATYGDGGKT